jgi:hypothetical protein
MEQLAALAASRDPAFTMTISAAGFVCVALIVYWILGKRGDRRRPPGPPQSDE